jgi:hypothetical protein
MVRVEIIANHSVEENILDAFAREGVGKFYTKYPSVFGTGNSGPRMGDAVWPEENFALIVWCEEEEARGIARAVTAVKKQFPDEGIRIFGIPPEAGRFPHAAPPRPASHEEARESPSHAPVQAVYVAPPVPPPAVPVAPAYTAPTPPVSPVAPAAPTPAHMPIAPVAPAAPPVPAAEPPPGVNIGKEYDGQNMEY